MANIIRIQDLTPKELSELLAFNADRMSDDHTSAVQDCASEISSIKVACDVLDRLHKLDEAA